MASPLAETAKANSTCNAVQSKQVGDLAKGIQANLDIQKQELAGVQFLQAMSNAKSNSTQDFKNIQKAVLNIQQQGIDIRTNNQKLAQQVNSPAQMGLAIVATAQITEKDQVTSLNGSCADQGTLKTLVKEVQDGTKQNKKNLQAAQSQCGK
ncbi:uncharacterized protein CC84DRAFT_1105207 [Paraphaeosphaeria sporulosa]|uniref:Uncharacterized protein n=1 Tax=Paraphaeosphaeria sporulosa TaxID=1460663 RepID=A0A177BUD6_9PLEO|nr:uncharacterized protein CC84DRAFT_1105207 [Paraphaeosphaeria sporulosa]OAF98894.1 hypothetical protein CC84DRAFT_1105207 [Paraphaeosphaeria sporulosa]